MHVSCCRRSELQRTPAAHSVVRPRAQQPGHRGSSNGHAACDPRSQPLPLSWGKSAAQPWRPRVLHSQRPFPQLRWVSDPPPATVELNKRWAALPCWVTVEVGTPWAFRRSVKSPFWRWRWQSFEFRLFLTSQKILWCFADSSWNALLCLGVLKGNFYMPGQGLITCACAHWLGKEFGWMKAAKRNKTSPMWPTMRRDLEITTFTSTSLIRNFLPNQFFCFERQGRGEKD